METETDKIFKKQLRILPEEVVDFISSTNWDEDLGEIGSLYNLSKEEVALLEREVTLVLMGLVHPDEFRDALEEEGVVTNRAVLEALVANVENKIFAPIRPALIEFLEKEAEKNTLAQAPDNLPTEETVESFLPKLTPKIIMPAPVGQEAVHPFEEKMQDLFTAGQPPVSNVAVAPAIQNFPQENLGGQAIPQTFTPVAPAPQVQKAPPSSPLSSTDPYRETIE